MTNKGNKLMTEVATGRDIVLNWDVLVTPGIPAVTSDLAPGTKQLMWSPISSTLISGKRDSVLVDTFITVEQADILVDWVAASGKNLTTIYVTHGHGDHFFGIGVLLDRFPNARALATPDVVKLMRQQASPDFLANFWNSLFPGQIPDRPVIAEELKRNVIDLEGHDLVVVEVAIPTLTTRPVCMSLRLAWWLPATSPITTFTSISPSRTRKPAVSGSLRSTKSSHSTHAL
jgi:hypothetical protein